MHLNIKMIVVGICSLILAGCAYKESTHLSEDRCQDDPWNAVGIWENFPDHAMGVEIQVRDEFNPVGYKYKLVERRGANICALQCFKDPEKLSLEQLSARWGISLADFAVFGEGGDGGKHATILIGGGK